MTCSAQQSQLLTHYRGTTWLGVTFTTRWNGGTPPSPAVSAALKFKKGATTVTLTSTGGSPTLTITDATEWTVVAVAQSLALTAAGDWGFELEVTNALGQVFVTANGIMRVEADVS